MSAVFVSYAVSTEQYFDLTTLLFFVKEGTVENALISYDGFLNNFRPLSPNMMFSINLLPHIQRK